MQRELRRITRRDERFELLLRADESADETASREAQDVPLAVGAGEIERNRCAAARGSAADLRAFELDAVRQIDAHAVRIAAHGAPDRLAGGLEQPRYSDAR